MSKLSGFDFCHQISSQEFKRVTPRELAEQLQVSQRTLNRMIADKRLPEPMRSPKGYNQGWLVEELRQWR